MEKLIKQGTEGIILGCTEISLPVDNKGLWFMSEQPVWSKVIANSQKNPKTKTNRRSKTIMMKATKSLIEKKKKRCAQVLCQWIA
jgi:hypothetical protein